MAKLAAEKREGRGKYKAFDLRKAGRIPGVIYGKSLKENINVSVALKEFAQLLKEGERLVDLDMGGAPMRVLLKAVQHGTYEHELLHVDFRAVSDDEIIEVILDIVLEGVEEAPGMREGGMIEHNLHQVGARCLPKNLPERVVVNVSGLKMGDILYARDLPRLEGVEFVFHGNPAVVACHHPAGEEVAASAEVAPSAPEVIGEKEREAKAKE